MYLFQYLCPVIFYLSGTGNTRRAAQQLAEATGEELIAMPDATLGDMTRALRPGERVGFCFPVHAWRPPRVVRRFVDKLALKTQGHYVFALCTAGDNIGETMDIMRNDLKERGISLDATYSLIMPNTYVGLPFMDVDKPELEAQKLADAEQRMKQYAKDIEQRRPAEAKSDIGRWPKINSRILGGLSVDYLNSDKHFRVDEVKCVKCGICANVCPLHNINGGLGFLPQWKHEDSCMDCFACFHHCPHHAIEFGNMTRNKGQYFYNHPKRRATK